MPRALRSAEAMLQADHNSYTASGKVSTAQHSIMEATATNLPSTTASGWSHRAGGMAPGLPGRAAAAWWRQHGLGRFGCQPSYAAPASKASCSAVPVLIHPDVKAHPRVADPLKALAAILRVSQAACCFAQHKGEHCQRHSRECRQCAQIGQLQTPQGSQLCHASTPCTSGALHGREHLREQYCKHHIEAL